MLIDATLGVDVQFDATFLAHNQHPVTLCHCPAHRTPGPLLADGECAQFDDAHGVVFAIDLDWHQHREILTGYRGQNPDVPIRVVARVEQAARFADFPSTVGV